MLTISKGGVWNANIYPGVRCDVPAHAYQSTFAASPQWSEAYAKGAEIKSYWRKLADEYDVNKYIHLNSRVESAEWSEGKGKWLVTISEQQGDVQRTLIDEANFLITGTGHFSDPRLPAYPGMNEYQGHLRHSSNWDPNFDPNGKRIAVIGNGASGIQVLPQLQKVAQHIDHYARNPTWVAAPLGGEKHAAFVDDNIAKARESPAEYVKFRKELESTLFSRFGGIFKHTDRNDEARKSITALMTKRLGTRDDLVDQIIPIFPPSCRRLTPGPGYLEALTADNVSYITDEIDHFVRDGIVTKDGTHNFVLFYPGHVYDTQQTKHESAAV